MMPMIPRFIDQRSIIGPPEPSVTSPCTFLKPLFRLPTSSSKFDSFPNPQNPPNQAQNASKTLPQTLPKRLQNELLSCKPRKSKKMQTFHTKTSFLTFPDPRKSSQNRCQNALKISFILDTLLEPQKIRFLMLKGRQDGPPIFLMFFCFFLIFFRRRPQTAFKRNIYSNV